MTSYDDTKVQLTINRMTEECYENVPNKSSTELYLVSQDPTSIAKIDLDAQSRTDAEISSIQSDLNDLSTEVSTLSEWTTTQIDDLIGDVQEVSSQTAQNAQDIADMSASIDDISANLTHSTVRRWEYVEYNGLTFTAEEANSTVAMQKVGSAPDVSLEYSTGNGWNDFIVGETTVTLPAIGDQMVLRAKTTNTSFATNGSNYNKFAMTGKIASSDSMMYLLKKDGDIDTIPGNFCFCRLFTDCTSLTSAPELPATALRQNCYQGMFQNCTALTTPPPALPAQQLPYMAYNHMFDGCSSLTATPATLGATTMTGADTMSGMFGNCTSLRTAFDINVAAPAPSTFYGTFYRCHSLTSVNMPQMTQAPQNAFREMFYECSSLTNAPDVFANITAVGQQAFSKTFYGCTSITQIPTLPSATGNGLARFCFEHMFEGCTGLSGTIDLTQFTDIQGTGNAYGAFDFAFQGCTGITKVDLSNLTTAHGIYHEFDGCTSLVELDLSNLETIRSDSQSVFENMCNGCTSLTTVYLNKLASMRSATGQWHNTFKGCSSLENVFIDKTQTIPYFYNNDTFTGTNADFRILVPDALYDQWIVASGWSAQGVVEHIMGAIEAETLTFTARQANSTIAMTAVGSAPSISLEYSTDHGDTWNDFTVGSTTITLSNVGDRAHIRAKTPNAQMATADGNRNTFSITGEVEASGNLAALFNKDVEQGKVLDSTLTWHIGGLFRGCSGLVGSAKNLKMPFVQMYSNSCETMFRESGITVAPDLPCMNVGIGSYSNMFYGCSSLTTAPELPATTINNYAYYHMFENCTSLTTPPSVLPATAPYRDCYRAMFIGCTSLSRTPDIKMENTWSSTQNVMWDMFKNCTSLETATVNYMTLNNAANGMAYMFYNCTSLKNVGLKRLRGVGTNITSGMTQMLYGCSALEVVDFSEATSVPTLHSVNTFQNTNSTFQIVVPDALYDQWKAARNWSSFANQIVKASEYNNN